MAISDTSASASEGPRSGACTCFRLRKLSRQMTLLYDQQLAPFGLTVTQFSLLAHLRGLADGIGIGPLAASVAIDPTALTRTLKPLERSGLVTIAADAADKRARRVRITDKGQATYVAARPAWQAAQRHVDAVLQATDVPALNRLLDTVFEGLKSAPVEIEPAPRTSTGENP